MKGISIGPAGGHGLSRMQGTTLAGRTTYLPNDDIPFEGVKVPVPIEDAIMYFTGFSCYLHCAHVMFFNFDMVMGEI